MSKRMMFVNRRAPYGTVYGLEALDALLAASAFDQQLCVAFLDDGVYQLLRNQNPAVLDMKDYSRTFAALDDFGVDKVYVERESILQRGLCDADLIEIRRENGSDAVSIMASEDMSRLMESQDIILQF